MNGIPERIKELRKRLEVTQEQLGALAGVTKAAISSWELGVTKPGGDALLALQNNAGVNPHWVLNNEGKPFSRVGEEAAHYDVANDITIIIDLLKRTSPNGRAVIRSMLEQMPRTDDSEKPITEEDDLL